MCTIKEHGYVAAYWDEVEQKCHGIFTRHIKDKNVEDIFSTQPTGTMRKSCTQLPGPLGMCTRLLGLCTYTCGQLPGPLGLCSCPSARHLRPTPLRGPHQLLYQPSHARDKP
ncbi:hypothetical protein GQ457_17G009810 [Hibiscus cannabinus]